MNLRKSLLKIIGILCLLGLVACGKIWGGITWNSNGWSAFSYAYACSSATVIGVGQQTSIAPTQSGTNGGFSVSPALPTGLSLDPSTGIISGTPTVVSGPTVYIVSSNILSATVNIQTVNGYVVNSLGDATDNTPGDHICATAGGVCTLRAAIVESNADGPGTYNILVPSTQPTGILLGSTLPLNRNFNIYGICSDASVIDGQGVNQIFIVNPNNVTILLQSLTLQNGIAARGGAFWTNFNTGITFIGISDIFKNNISTAGAASGGAIAIDTNNSMSCTDCVFDTNQAANDGGGIGTQGTTLTLLRNLFVNNVATSTAGGGVYSSSSVSTTITNSTFYNNTSSGGGGVFLNFAGAAYTLTNNTFVNNVATSVGLGGGALDSNGGVTATFANNLMYNNTGNAGQCSVTTTSNGGNLVTPSTPHCVFGQPTDITTTPTLGPYQNNGGFSNTLALLPGSAGIDVGVAGFCPSTDQRLYPRLTDGKCDIGAYEVQP